MANSPLNIKVGVILGTFNTSLKRVGASLLSTNNLVNKSFGGWYNNVRKVNQAYVNLNKDLNRSNQGLFKFSKLSGGLLGGGVSAIGMSLGIGSVYALGSAMAGAIQSSFDMIETQNLFNVSMRSTSEETGKVIQKMSEVYGLDPTNLKNAVGTYSLLARSMGLSADQSQKLALTTTQLAVDLSSLMNIPIEQVMSDLRSGLLGQSETVYKYGVDVTEAGLKTEALAQGITKSVRNMSQGEKMALRYNLIIKNAALSHGDFAKTLDQPANQLKILGERMTTLQRSFGTLFTNMIGNVLPYINAFVRLLTEAVKLLAKLFGYEEPKDENLSESMGAVSESAEEATDAINRVGEAIKNATLGLDELNVLNKAVSNIGSGSSGDSILDDIDLASYDNLMDTIQSKSSLIFANLKQAAKDFISFFNFEGIKNSFDELKDKIEPLVSKIRDGLGWVWKNILVPFGKWFIEEAFPATVELVSAAFDVLNKVLDELRPVAMWLWESFLKPIATWTGELLINGIQTLVEKLKDFSKWIDNNEGKITTITKLVAGFFVAWKFSEFVLNVPIFLGKLALIVAKLGVLDGALWAVIINTFLLTAGFFILGFGILTLMENWDKLSGIEKFVTIFTAVAAAAIAAAVAVAAFHTSWSVGLAAAAIAAGLALITTQFLILKDEFRLPVGNVSSVIDGKGGGGRSFSAFEDGGFPQTGEFFIARENGPELVGSIGGKSAVANNDQIVDGVADGVYRAVKEAMSEQTDRPLIVELDGEVIYKNQQKIANGKGTSFGMGVFAR